VVFQSIPDDMKPKRPPSEGLQFFGSVRVDGQSEVMTVSLYNLEGSKLYGADLEPQQKTG
jgi:alkaline phosphatase D